ncbi:hypothetical protein FHT91_000225 [Rhizobium sp. BK347]|nr:hypothetical protein [Rhizobium sp. BK252]MBB3400007.1 hypothetical protein [Rhizobium sp. BK289]MBB3412587.1 hypothetical protein [Rhizobium sp. BK284]MBB3480473.1 hypothetical protein [Rhizobium sp. BK347]
MKYLSSNEYPEPPFYLVPGLRQNPVGFISIQILGVFHRVYRHGSYDADRHNNQLFRRSVSVILDAPVYNLAADVPLAGACLKREPICPL